MPELSPRELFDQCADLVNAYPLGTRALTPAFPVAGRGFFPVASGSFHQHRVDRPIGPRKIMFVGQDWGAEGSLEHLTSNPDADMQSSTAARLCDLIEEAGIPSAECFFTNALFGVRAGAISVGRSPGWKDRAFVAASAAALNRQIEVTQPGAIICLGRDAPQSLAVIIPECKAWNGLAFKTIDENGRSILALSWPNQPIVAAILTHPSYRHINARHRRFDGASGHAAEVRMLRALWALANLKGI